MKGFVQRRASRLILFDRERRVLLLRHAGANRGVFWALPGGGLESGETFEQAALREASEELGLTPLSLRRLWERMTDFTYFDRLSVNTSVFFLIEGELPNISSDMQRFHAQEEILELRWWTTDEIDSTSEPVFPEELTSELRKI